MDKNYTTLDKSLVGKEISGISHEKNLIYEGALDTSGDNALN